MEITEKNNLPLSEENIVAQEDDILLIGDLFPETEEDKVKKQKRSENANYYSDQFILAKEKIMSDEQKKIYFKEKVKLRRKGERQRKQKKISEKIQSFATKEEKDQWIKSYQVEKEKRMEVMKGNLKNGTKVVFDCSFEGTMNDKELKSAALQINSCYGVNKATDANISFNVTAVTDKIEQYLDGFRAKNW